MIWYIEYLTKLIVLKNCIYLYKIKELKKKKIEELLEYIEERLKELEEEKEELRQFQDADKEKRCIEYALTQQELEYINKILNEVNIV